MPEQEQRNRQERGAGRGGSKFGGVQKQNAFVTSWNDLLLPELYIARSLPIGSFSFLWQMSVLTDFGVSLLKFAKNVFLLLSFSLSSLFSFLCLFIVTIK